jgi:TonB family protein
MRVLSGVLLAFLVPSCLVAQQTEADLRARLVKAPLYLRRQWSADKLTFDAAGNLKGASAPTTFTLSGIDIESVKLTSKGLALRGRRVGLEFNTNVPYRIGLAVRSAFGGSDPEKMTLEIARPADGDFKAPLDAIFTDNIADLVPQLPGYWQTFAHQHLLPSPDSTAAQAGGFGSAPGGGRPQPRPAGEKRIGGSVTAPQLLSKVDPNFDEAARALKYSGIVLVNLVVDATGTPRQVRILRPTGLGLDEQAIAAVQQYTFKPAMQDGKPVAVELNVEVNFQIF